MAVIFGIQTKGLVSKLSGAEDELLISLENSIKSHKSNLESIRLVLINLNQISANLEVCEKHGLEFPEDLDALKSKIEALQNSQNKQDYLFYLFELIQAVEEWITRIGSATIFGRKRKSSLFNKVLEKAREEITLSFTVLLEELRSNLKAFRKSIQAAKATTPPVSIPPKLNNKTTETVASNPVSELRSSIKDFLTGLRQLSNDEIQAQMQWLNLVEEEIHNAKSRCLEVDRDFFSHWATEMKKSDLLEALLDNYDQKIYQTNQRNDLSEDEKLKRVKLWKTLQQFEIQRLKEVQENLED